MTHLRVLVTGVDGQDGHYLSKQLTEQGHEVWGLVHRQHIQELPYARIVRGDLADTSSVLKAVKEVRPHEIYNMGAISHVMYSHAEPEHTLNVNGTGLVRICEAAQHFAPHARIYQASSSELFGNGPMPANEDSPFNPVSPYATGKLVAHQMAASFRSQGLWVTCGILFNHVSPRSGREFIMHKLIDSALKARAEEIDSVPVGDLTPKRDFGWAPEYCDGVIRMLRYSEPTDMVLATGVSVSMRDLGRHIFRAKGLDFEEYAVQDPALLRPVEIFNLQGDASFAQRAIGWLPQMTWDKIADRLIEERQRAQAGIALSA
jgi:GDPmannose 4,6-dehydratase|tara:strand:- start:6225 stop:7178 length:954 start_codon:yes stop_codon:yes gene_type:complete